MLLLVGSLALKKAALTLRLLRLWMEPVKFWEPCFQHPGLHFYSQGCAALAAFPRTLLAIQLEELKSCQSNCRPESTEWAGEKWGPCLLQRCMWNHIFPWMGFEPTILDLGGDLNPGSFNWNHSPGIRTYWSSGSFVSSQKEFSVRQSNRQRMSLLA